MASFGMDTVDSTGLPGGARRWGRELRRVAMGGGAVVILAITGTQGARAEWSEQEYNPRPLAGDLLLPMPCGGFMAFRRVDVPVGGAAKEGGRRFRGLVGVFRDPGGSDNRHYWIGKYEVTERQYEAGKGQGCDLAVKGGRLPKVGVNATDAAVFSERYSVWLQEQRHVTLPREGDFMAHARLPTEAEWEFAARGGMKAPEGGLSAPLVLGEAEALDLYARHSSPLSSTSGLGKIGLLKENPLGLYDVLGNAAEIVQGEFRPAVRGGDYLTATANLNLDTRHEFLSYLAESAGGGANRLETIGFRVVLSVHPTGDRADPQGRAGPEGSDGEDLKAQKEAAHLRSETERLKAEIAAKEREEREFRAKAAAELERLKAQKARAEAERIKAEAERLKAEAERLKAESERLKAEKEARRLVTKPEPTATETPPAVPSGKGDGPVAVAKVDPVELPAKGPEGPPAKKAENPRCDISEANLGGRNFDQCDLTTANLSGKDLSGASLGGAKLSGANLDGANLDGAKLGGANLTAASLAGAKLRGADLFEANFANANLAGADLQGAKMKRADLTGADVTNVNWREAYVMKTIIKKVRNLDCSIFNTAYQAARAEIDNNCN